MLKEIFEFIFRIIFGIGYAGIVLVIGLLFDSNVPRLFKIKLFVVSLIIVIICHL
jgi:hypothetical protein